MPSPVEVLKQENKETTHSPKMTTSAHKTPVKQEHGGYFYSHQFQTPSARSTHAQLSGGHSQSPQWKTPSSASSRGTPRIATPSSSGSRKLTPRYHTTPGGSTRHIVPNPFEGQLLERLKSNSPMFSPNMFKITEPGSAEKSPPTFRWSIDQLAILKPAELEEMPIQQDTLNLVKDPAEEARVQEAIDSYFSAGNIAPSPWTENVRKFILPRTPDVERERSITLMDNLPPEMLTSPGDKHEASCQTVLTLPVDFNLQELLGEHYTYTSSQQEAAAAAQAALLFPDSDSPADLSTSSLRRKLFFHGDEGTPLSPVRSNKSRVAEVMDMSSPAVSPVRSHTSLLSRQSPLQTPASSHFSSSPIRGVEQTPSLRRCSTAPSLMHSPQISPITSSDVSTKGSGGGTPFCLPLEATPSSGRSSGRKWDSPGISPIGPQNNGSYMETSPQEKLTFSRSDSLRRRALIGQTEKHATPPDLDASPVIVQPKHSALFSPEDCSSRSNRHSTIDLDSVKDAKCRIVFDQPADLSLDMDVSSSSAQHHEDDDDVRMPSAFRDFRETDEFDGENTTGFLLTACPDNAQSQDTGYQTQNSQSAITEATVSSNLTSHFSNLHAALSGSSSSKDGASCTDPDVELRHSLEEMSDFYSRISHSISEVTPSGKKDKLGGVAHPLSSTVMSPPVLDNKDKPMEQVFEELQQFANKFSNPAFGPARQAKGLLTEDGTSKLHKSYSMSEFHVALKKQGSNSIQGSQSNALLDCNEKNEYPGSEEGNVQFECGRRVIKEPACCARDSNVFGSRGQMTQSVFPSERVGDATSVFERATHKKALTRSVSDYTGSMGLCEEAQGEDEVVSLSQGLYKGRPALGNPAFTIETLTATGGAKCVEDLPLYRDGYSQSSHAAKLGTERVIKPLLLFAEDQQLGGRSYTSEADYATEKTESISVAMQQKRKAPLLDSQLSLPESLLCASTHPPSPTYPVEDKVLGSKSKRQLANDLYVEQNVRPKRKSPTPVSWYPESSADSNYVQYEDSNMECSK